MVHFHRASCVERSTGIRRVANRKHNGGYGTTVYIDSETLRHQGNVVTMWVLFDFPGMKVMDGISSRSMRAQFQIDCDQELYRSLAVTRFSGNMATGKVVSNAAGKGKWAPVAPKTVAKMLMNSQCKE